MVRNKSKQEMALVFKEDLRCHEMAWLRLALLTEFMICREEGEASEWTRLVSSAIHQIEIRDYAQLKRTIGKIEAYEL